MGGSDMKYLLTLGLMLAITLYPEPRRSMKGGERLMESRTTYPSRFNNRGVSNNDNLLVFWLNNVEIKRLKIDYGPNYESVICGWLDRDLSIETLNDRINQVRENEITGNFEPPEPKPAALRIADTAGNWVFVRNTNNSAWTRAAQKAGKSVVMWAEDVLDKAAAVAQ